MKKVAGGVVLQMVECSNCGGDAKLYLSSKDYNRGVTEETFTYYRCKKCGVVFLDPVPDDLSTYYPNDYYGDIPSSEEEILSAAKRVEQYKLDLVNDNCEGVKSILEIGPSMGAFLSLVKNDGYEARAIELNKDCSEFINRALDVPCVHADNEILALESQEPVDLLVMWHVIEHIKNPHKFLRESFSKINKDGYLILSAPNINSIQFALLRSRWVHIDAPRHVAFIEKKSLELFLMDNGFDICLSTTRDRGGKKWNKFGWIESMRIISSKRKGFVLGKIFILLSYFFENVLDFGSCYTIVARKKN